MSVPIVGRLRTEWRRWKGQASGRPPRRCAASRRPQVEGLEARALLTASFTEYPMPGEATYYAEPDCGGSGRKPLVHRLDTDDRSAR